MIHRDCPEPHRVYKRCDTCEELKAMDRRVRNYGLFVIAVIFAIIALVRLWPST